MDPKLPEGLDSAFEPFQSEVGNYVRLAYSIFPDDYEPLDDPYGKQKSSAFIERVDDRWFAGIEFADEHRKRGLSRLAIHGLCNYVDKQADKYNLYPDTPIYIAADSSVGFWKYTGFIKNTDQPGPELVSTLGRMCAWAAPTPESSARTVMRRPSRLSRTRTTPYSRKGGKAKKSKTVRRKTKGRKSQRHKRIRSTTIKHKTQRHKSH